MTFYKDTDFSPSVKIDYELLVIGLNQLITSVEMDESEKKRIRVQINLIRAEEQKNKSK